MLNTRQGPKLLIFNIVFFICITCSTALHAQSWQGKVVGVTDGDTVVVFNGSGTVKIRISEIDCPENGQPFSRAAKRFTSGFCFGKEVVVIPETIDKYGRTVAHIRTLEGSDLSTEIVAAGLAWHYKKYSSSQLLSNLEQNARKNKWGLWQDNDPIAPWNWRHGIRNSSQLTQPSAVLDNEYHGNVSSFVFHKSTCKYFNCKNCRKIFRSREEAIQHGFRPCGLCRP